MRLRATFLLLLWLAAPAFAQGVGGSRITDLPQASLPMSGAEAINVIQGGISKQSAVGNLPFTALFINPNIWQGQQTFDGATIFNGPVTFNGSVNLPGAATIIPISGADMSVPINAALAAGFPVKLVCGVYTLNNSILMPSNSNLFGSGPCTTIRANSTISGNAQWANVNANPTFATAISNIDMLNGNSNIQIHDLNVDISQQVTPPAAGGRFIWGIGFGTASNYSVWNVNLLGKGDVHGSGQDGIASLNSHDGHIYSDYIYGMGNGSLDIFQGSHDIKIDHNIVDTNSTGFGVTANGSGKNSSGTIIPTPVYSIIIDHNEFRNTLEGLLLTGLCTNTTGVCGTNYNFVVNGNIIINVTLFHGISVGDSSNYVITSNQISNVEDSCITVQSAIAGGGGITSGSLIANNHCSNINLGDVTRPTGGNNAAISVGNGSDVPTNTTLMGNTVLNALPKASAVTFPYAVAVDAQVVGNTLTGTFSGVIIPSVGQILTGVGITGSPTITAANGSPPTSWTISGPSQGTVGPETMSVSGQVVTSLSINAGGYCTTAPTVVFTGVGTGASATATLANGTSGSLTALTLLSGGSGYTSPPTISFTNCNPPQYTYATRVFNGAVNTSFSPGAEEAGSLGTDLIAGSTAPITAYGSWNFLSEATFSDSSVGLNIANTDATKYAQARFTALGATRAFQIGEGGGSETSFGVASCAFLFDSLGSVVVWKTCAGDAFNILTTLLMPNIPTSAGSGGLYVCVDSTGATYKKASCP